MELTTVCRTRKLDANQTKGSQHDSALVADSTRGPMTQSTDPWRQIQERHKAEGVLVQALKPISAPNDRSPRADRQLGRTGPVG